MAGTGQDDDELLAAEAARPCRPTDGGGQGAGDGGDGPVAQRRWPKRSLTVLKWSMSTTSRDSCPVRGRCARSASSARSR
jgi:hypothetical protein